MQASRKTDLTGKLIPRCHCGRPIYSREHNLCWAHYQQKQGHKANRQH